MDTLCLDLINIIKIKLPASECIFVGFTIETEDDYFDMLNDRQRLEFAIKTNNINWIHELRLNVNKLVVIKYAIENGINWLIDPKTIPENLLHLLDCPSGTSVDTYLTIFHWKNTKTDEDLKLSIFAINKQHDLFIEYYSRCSEQTRSRWQDYMLLFLHNNYQDQDVDFVLEFLYNNQHLKADKSFVCQLVMLRQYDILAYVLEYLFSNTEIMLVYLWLYNGILKTLVIDGQISLLSKYNKICSKDDCIDAIIISCINSDIEALTILNQSYVKDDDMFISIVSNYCMTDEVYRYLLKHPGVDKRRLKPPGSTFKLIHKIIEDLRPYIEETDCFNHMVMRSLRCDIELIMAICATIIKQATSFETVIGVFEVIGHMDIKTFIKNLTSKGDGGYVDTIKHYAMFTEKQLEDIAELFGLGVNDGRLLLRVITHPNIWRCKMVQ